MKVGDIVTALDHFAPLPLQEGWDNAGLQVGLPAAEVSGALLCLDVTEAIIDEAVRSGCNLIVSHHPLIFRPLRHITGATEPERVVRRCLREDIAVVSMHTNLDNAPQGVNRRIADTLGLTDIRLIGRRSGGGIEGGSGVIGRLQGPMAADDFIIEVKRRFDVECALAGELLRRPIATVAICGGAGDCLLDEAIAEGADAFITGEIHYHTYFGHQQEIQLLAIGHYQSEQFTAQLLADILAEAFPEMKLCVAQTNTNPILYI